MFYDLDDCVVANCPNKGSHYLPRKEALKAQWIKALNLDVNRKAGRSLRAGTKICSGHFKPTDIRYSAPYGIKRKHLRPNTLPSVLHALPIPNDDEIKLDETQSNFNHTSNLRTYLQRTSFVKEQVFPNCDINENAEDPLALIPDYNDLKIEIKREVLTDEAETNIFKNTEILTDQQQSGSTSTKFSSKSTQTDSWSDGLNLYEMRYFDKHIHFMARLEH